MNKELIKKAFQLGYFGEMEKKADPPNRGLNDPNPLKREIYKRWGYIAPNSNSYISSKETAPDYADQGRYALSSGRSRKNPAHLAQLIDFGRSRGDVPTSYLTRGSDVTKKKPAVILGQYPMSSPEVAAHELGHAQDDKNINDRSWFLSKVMRPGFLFDKEYARDTLGAEQRAWDLAGTPKDHPLRRAALRTYETALAAQQNARRNQNSQRPTSVLQRLFSGIPNFSGQQRGNKKRGGRINPSVARRNGQLLTDALQAKDNAFDVSRRYYQRPQLYADKLVEEHPDVNFIYDYDSALRATGATKEK